MDYKILDLIANEINDNFVDGGIDKNLLLEQLERLKSQRLNIMFVGATGVGKSSTINAIFNMEVAKVGYSVDPETDAVGKYEIDNMVLWDTPGLGDSPKKDQEYAVKISSALKERDAQGDLLIDGVVILLDASTRDMKTSYEIIEKIIVPYIGDPNRIVIAINQCDIALKGRHWNYDQKRPDPQLISFLEEKAVSVKKRVMESTGISVSPVYYSALHHYNISKLLLSIIKSMPETKRFLFTDSLNKDPNVWKINDEIKNYNEEIQQEMKGSLSKALDGAAKGAVAGATVGGLIPVIGPVIGAAVGGILGFLGGLIER